MKTLNHLITFIIQVFLFTISQNVLAQERREIGNMILEGVPEIAEEIQQRIQQYQDTRSAAFVDWLPDDQGILMSTRFGNTVQLHTIASPGGARNQITFYEEPVANGMYNTGHAHDGFMFAKDIGGDEQSQLYWYDMKTRKTEMVSDGYSRNLAYMFSNQGNRFTFTSTRRNNKDFDVYISDMSSPREATMIVGEETECGLLGIGLQMIKSL